MPVTDTLSIARSRGMRDLLPQRMRAFRRAEDAFRRAAARWGYEEIRTPTIETFGLFTWAGALNPDMLQRVYSFLDWDGWSGERVVLRPDSTVPVGRAAREAGLALPARLSYVQNVFRFSPGDADREEWQFGLEYLQAPDALGDIEAILVAAETLEALGLTATIRLSHAGLLSSLLASIAATPEEKDALRSRVADEGPLALRDVPIEADTRSIIDAMSVGSGGSGFVRNLRALAGERLNGTREALNSLEQVAVALEAIGVDVSVTPTMVLDFEYYTGVVVQLVVDGDVIGAGGRYAPPGETEPTTACGLAIDVSELLARMQPASGERPAVPIVYRDDSALHAALELSRTLHNHGLAASPARSADPDVVRVEVDLTSITVVAGSERHEIQGTENLVARLLQLK